MNASRAGCRLTIAIPAKNERATIARAMQAFTEQRDLDGSPMDPRTFEVLILANDCEDDTASIARGCASRHPAFTFDVRSRSLPPGVAHVGTARRLALDLALARQRAACGDAGIIASTDADSIVDPYWVAGTLAELAHADAVAGHVEIAEAERQAMEVPLRVLYDRERAYRHAVGAIEARFDPRPFDPPRRHDAFVGASFAVRVDTYAAAGGLPALPTLEDFAFARALRRIDARVRHSYDVRVTTSGRANARVDGGFGSFILDLRARGARRGTFRVESGLRRVLRAKARGLLRECWTSPSDPTLLSAAADAYVMTSRTLRALLDPFAPLGESLERIEAQGVAFEALPDEPVEVALATLRNVLSAARIEHPLGGRIPMRAKLR